MITIQHKSPKCRRPYLQSTCDQGFEAAKAEKPLTQLDIDVPFDPVGRSAWLTGWEAGGGVVTRGIVVTQPMRLQERKAEILKELEVIEAQLTAVSDA
jgi:hypothetical protein